MASPLPLTASLTPTAFRSISCAAEAPPARASVRANAAASVRRRTQPLSRLQPGTTTLERGKSEARGRAQMALVRARLDDQAQLLDDEAELVLGVVEMRPEPDPRV